MMEITGINIAIGGGGEGGGGKLIRVQFFLVSSQHCPFRRFFAKYFVEGCLHFMTADCNGKISGFKETTSFYGV